MCDEIRFSRNFVDNRLEKKTEVESIENKLKVVFKAKDLSLESIDRSETMQFLSPFTERTFFTCSNIYIIDLCSPKEIITRIN